MTSLEFRRARKSDFDWLYQLNKKSYEKVVLDQFGNWDESFQRKMFSDNWKDRVADIIISNSIDIGVLSLEQRKEYDWLQEIQLTHDYQNLGIGTQIINDCISSARKRRQPLRLQVLHQNHAAKRLYTRLGFTEIGSLEHHFLMELN